MKCDLCGKGPQFGFKVSHSKRHTNREWQPNIHTATLTIEGVQKKVKACTRCLRTYDKDIVKAG
ncbi:MAG: 50S ribosomal protein L28 [Chloroflexi bacterium]|nr:50S ribosomal protein L28 [Chloroflexota bacterium]